ncbi:sulfurtransferase [Nitrincola tibetensis]|uniref:Sulfurtransferase n=1 Tax=Nitrincola tibetensis TaxID=2219697 RepID=A0A364NS22_9GAMM|nr:sulfurtransferase [Nitrincola tibetensis]RAU19886.1 sulfurtransferase [Nitrincola tibetensis]
MHSSPLVTSQWLQTHLQDPDLVVIEASIGKVIGKEPIVYESPVCIPNAIKLDIETDLSDLTSNAVHAFPSLEQMRSLLKRLGISQRQTLVIYDNQGIYAAPRVWWIFKTFGFDKVYILDGGLPHWLQERRTVADVYKESTGGAVDEELQLNPTYLKSSDEILSNIQSPSFTVVDARSEDRFMGRVAEPRQGVRSGHIPQSVNLPFPNVLNEYFYKSPQELGQIFGSLSLEPSRAIVFSCGSGITACILLVAAILAGRQQVSLYDGSWAEWGAGEVFPVEVGA